LVVFIGMGATVLQVVQGRAPAEVRHTPYRDGLLTGAPVLILMAVVLLLGLYIPTPISDLLHDAVRFLEVRP
jgi:hydrogenase-4 component F